jgi:hypothetical protein
VRVAAVAVAARVKTWPRRIGVGEASVALQQVRQRLIRTPAAIIDNRREASAAARLEHGLAVLPPRLVQVHVQLVRGRGEMLRVVDIENHHILARIRRARPVRRQLVRHKGDAAASIRKVAELTFFTSSQIKKVYQYTDQSESMHSQNSIRKVAELTFFTSSQASSQYTA